MSKWSIGRIYKAVSGSNFYTRSNSFPRLMRCLCSPWNDHSSSPESLLLRAVILKASSTGNMLEISIFSLHSDQLNQKPWGWGVAIYATTNTIVASDTHTKDWELQLTSAFSLHMLHKIWPTGQSPCAYWIFKLSFKYNNLNFKGCIQEICLLNFEVVE